MDKFFRVESECQVIWFRLSEIVAIETPNPPGKPTGWVDEVAAGVYLRNRSDAVTLTAEQWESLKTRLFHISETSYSQPRGIAKSNA